MSALQAAWRPLAALTPARMLASRLELDRAVCLCQQRWASTSQSLPASSAARQPGNTPRLPRSMVAPATKPAGLSAIPPQNIGSGLTTEDAARLLRSQPKHYVVARLYARNYLLTEGDQLTVPLLRIKPPQIAYKPQPSQPQGGVVPVGKKIRLHGIVEVGSRDYTLRAPEVLPSSADGTQIMPFVARRTASGTLDPQRVYVEAIVTEHTKSKMETLLKKKRRKNYQRTIKSKHDWTRLRITKIEVTMPGGAIAQRHGRLAVLFLPLFSCVTSDVDAPRTKAGFEALPAAMRWHWGFFFFVSATSAQLQIPFVNHAASQPQPAGPLVWGELNVLATTDIHGWLRGHASYGQQTAEETERNASGDLGDFYSFAIRMKALAAEQKRDLLLVDSGDLHDGNGLSDADPFIKGHTVMQLHRKLPYDITTIGNHELYNLTVAQDVHQTHARVLGERFLTSNVNITLASGESVPIGHRFRRWTTAQGRKLFALGVLFDFTGNAHGTVVQPVAAMLREEWLAEALYERPDAFVLVGHMSTRDDGWRAVIEHLHTRHPGVPVLTFAGHAHVRDCIQHTPASVTLASGRYFETIGWLSANISGPRLEFSRKYLDQNPTTYAYHLGLDRSSLSTSKGRGISAELQQYSHAWNLSHQFGTAPQSFYANRAPEWSSKSLLRLMTDVIFTTVMADTSRPLSHVMIMNTGGIRFDIFQGPFTTDSQWLVVPFESRHVFLPRVKRAHIEALLPALELHGPAIAARLRSQQALDDAQINADYAAHTRRMAALGQTDLEASTTSSLTEGYRTYDDCPGRGDDTLHRPIPSFAIPEYVTNALREGENEFDLAWFDFLTPLILATLNTVQQEYHYVQADVSVYSAIKEDEMLGVFARKYW